MNFLAEDVTEINEHGKAGDTFSGFNLADHAEAYVGLFSEFFLRQSQGAPSRLEVRAESFNLCFNLSGLSMGMPEATVVHW